MPSIYLIVLADDATAVPNANICEHARALSGVSAAMGKVNKAFNIAGAIDDRRHAHDDEATPEAYRGQFGSVGGERNRHVGRGGSVDHSTGRNDERRG